MRMLLLLSRQYEANSPALGGEQGKRAALLLILLELIDGVQAVAQDLPRALLSFCHLLQGCQHLPVLAGEHQAEPAIRAFPVSPAHLLPSATGFLRAQQPASPATLA